MSEPKSSMVIKLEIPENVLSAAELVCAKYDYDFNKLCVETIKGDLEALVDSDFEDYVKTVEDTPIMVDPKSAVYLNWWYQVYSKKFHYPTISEFLTDCVRKQIHKYLEQNVTDEEATLLNKMLEEAGIPDNKVFTLRVRELLET